MLDVSKLCDAGDLATTLTKESSIEESPSRVLPLTTLCIDAVVAKEESARLSSALEAAGFVLSVIIRSIFLLTRSSFSSASSTILLKYISAICAILLSISSAISSLTSASISAQRISAANSCAAKSVSGRLASRSNIRLTLCLSSSYLVMRTSTSGSWPSSSESLSVDGSKESACRYFQISQASTRLQLS